MTGSPQFGAREMPFCLRPTVFMSCANRPGSSSIPRKSAEIWG